MDLGAFSVSLSVKDINASHAFYTALGFEPVGGDLEQKWIVLRNGASVIGLFEGMFERNMLTFNPGWSADAQPLKEFTDVRSLQAQLKVAGVDFVTEAEPTGTGPASFILTDPDGNPVLVDQHVDRPG